jgi:hypothetical protein
MVMGDDEEDRHARMLSQLAPQPHSEVPPATEKPPISPEKLEKPLARRGRLVTPPARGECLDEAPATRWAHREQEPEQMNHWIYRPPGLSHHKVQGIGELHAVDAGRRPTPSSPDQTRDIQEHRRLRSRLTEHR